MVRELQDQIRQLKKERGVCVLAHSYQTADIIEIADFTGDSFQLSVAAQQTDAETVVMCGVRFMAETVKLLSPDKRVILPSPGATCPMAEQITPQEVTALKKKHPNAVVMAYINTTAALKTVCDVCVTSSSAVQIAKRVDSEEIIFVPDCNLGAFVASQVPEKKFILMEGGCPIHAAITGEEAAQAKREHPDALLLVHPECRIEVSKQADFVGSTSAIMAFAKKSKHREFIIGTEISIKELLQYACPDKIFHALSKGLICPDMKLTTLADTYAAVKGTGGAEIVLDDETMTRARRCIDEMLRLG